CRALHRGKTRLSAPAAGTTQGEGKPVQKISRIRVIPATCLRDVGEGERRGPTTGARDRVRSPKRPSKWRRTVFETNKKVEAALTPIRLILFESRGRPHP